MIFLVESLTESKYSQEYLFLWKLWEESKKLQTDFENTE